MHEALQGGRGRPFVGKCQVEELVQRVLGLRPQPRQHGLSAAVVLDRRLGQDPGEQFVGRDEINPCQQVAEPAPRRRYPLVRLARRDHSLPQAQVAPSAGQPVEIVIVETDKRAFEHGRKRQIIVRQKQKPGQCHQIHDRKLLGQHQTVHTGDRNVDFL